MKYRLGLDLGVSSIGSAIIELDENNNAKNIIDAGVRIFEVSEGAADRRSKRTARKNLVRTRKRLQLLAKKLFENQLWVNETPEGTDKLRSKSPYKIRHDALYEQLKNQNYIGRSILHLAKHRGAGFVSAASELEEEISEEEEKTKKKSSYEMIVQHLKDTNSRTIGEFFYKRITSDEVKERTIRQKDYAIKSKAVDYAIPRYLVKDEFNKIWDKQSQYFPQMQKEGLKKEIYDILFYEKAPAPYAIGKCIYFRDENRLLKAHPLSEMRRIYEEVNNIRIISDMEKKKLTISERDKIINNLLLKGENVGRKKIKEQLNLNGQLKVSIDDDKDDKVIKAYLYSRPEFAQIEYIKNLSENDLISFTEFLAEPINPNHKQKRLYTEDELIQQLKHILKINDEEQIGNLLTLLPKGRTNLGTTATTKILEELKKDVISHREVTDRLSKTNPNFKASEELARQNQGKCSQLPYYGKILQSDVQEFPPLIKEYKTKLAEQLTGKEKESLLDEIEWGKIANPAVHMILNQLRLVVNEIIKIYGKPYEINIELGRDVGMSKKRKEKVEREQKQNEKNNDAAKKYLQEHNIYINNKNILKYKLWEQQKHRDAYDPRIEIGQNNFLNFEIEHIIPRAKGGTNTFNNLCLVNRNDNLSKGDSFAYDYFVSSQKSEELRREILKHARANMPKKAWRFEPDARERFEEQGDSEETNRYLTDTRYVARMAKKYLRAIVDNSEDNDDIIHNRILPVKGEQTAVLRRNWNLLGLEYDLMGLNIPRYVPCTPYWQEMNTGEIKEVTNKPNIDGNWKFFDKTKNKEWMPKPRIDHRHHAMDAITIACVNRSLIQKLANEEKINHVEAPLPLSTIKSVGEFRRIVIEKLQQVNVSHKPNHSKAGELHKATGKTALKELEKEKSIITVYSRKISQAIKSIKDLEKLKIPNSIKNEWHKDIEADKIKQEKLFNDFNLYINTAEQILIAENEKAISEGKKEIKITEGRIISKAFEIIQDNGLWKNNKFKEYENSSSLIKIDKHKIAYLSGNNHCIDFYIKDGKISGEVIRRFDINDKNFIPNWKKEGGKIIWSVQQGDILELETPEEWKVYTDKERCLAEVTEFRYGRNQIGIKLVNDARNEENKSSKPLHMLPKILEDKSSNWLCKHHARKVELTPFGKIKKKHKVLWDGKKATA